MEDGQRPGSLGSLSAWEKMKILLFGFRIPKPTREADHWVGQLRRTYQATRNEHKES